jgi:hypothetical protein
MRSQYYTKTKSDIDITNFFLKLIIIIALLIAILGPVNASTIEASVSQNTSVPIVAEWPIGADTQVGEHFSARIIEDVVSDTGEIFIPKNSRVMGTVIDIKEAQSFHRGGQVNINFEKIIFPDNISVLKIDADGTLTKQNRILAKTGEGALQTMKGAITGASLGFRFGGIIGSGSSTASNIAIGAATGASISLISFIASKGQEVEINPGLPMILNINDMQSQKYKGLSLAKDLEKPVQAHIKRINEKRVSVNISNNLDQELPLTNLKIVDALGYTIKPNIGYKYHDKKVIAPNSIKQYEFEFTPTTKNAKYWIVLTDSFGKQEYFRQEI